MINKNKEKLRKLRTKEDEFNKSVAMVPESDPGIALINDRIAEVKDRIEKQNSERALQVAELKRVSELRQQIFISFFDSVQVNLEKVYQKLTAKDSTLQLGGKATLFLEDRT